jgi:electron transfer flavoprotein alpha/beta subunit
VKGNAVDLNNVRWYINPFCEIAMQEAANMKAKNQIKEIWAISIGPKGYFIFPIKVKENIMEPVGYGC